MNKIGVIAALPVEGRCLAPGNTSTGKNIIAGDNIVLHISGVGRDNALAAAAQLIDQNVDLLISWGVAASLSEPLQAGDLVLADRVMDSSGNAYLVQPQFLQALEVFSSQAGLPAQHGSIVETTEILGAENAKDRLHKVTGAIAADMETAAIATAATRAGIPFLPIRVISDDIHTNIPASITRNIDSFGRVKPIGLLGSLCLRPGDVLSLVRLARGFNRAHRTLERCAGHLKTPDRPE